MEAPTDTISVLLVDDHTLFRSGVRSLLQRNPRFTVVGEASDGVDGVKRALQLRPDVILLDLHMPGMTGVEALQVILQGWPEAAVIMLTVSEEGEDLATALQAGARGYLIKNIDADYLIRAVERAAAGESVLAESMAAKLVAQLQKQREPKPAAPPSELDKLTPREREILACLARGESNKLIARVLDLAESTVKIHVQNILKKLGLSSRVQAAVFAVEQGLNGSTER
ncbi:response regulator [Massilia norwichensis]|uniref:Response regulator n=1 Tax=Massilia norwichensis TaxID=1442366 RepID=A0ABT2A674_9BURK|nr:response regulator [Massilia norwichensis]MCS0589691.1 response regulator [Massilia norwichensis]